MAANQRLDPAGVTGSRVLLPEGNLSAGQALAVIGDVLGRVNHDRGLVADADRLEWARSAAKARRQIEALHASLVAEADRAGASSRVHGMGMTSWLATDGQTSTKEAAGAVFAGQDLAKHPATADRVLAGEIGMGQARAIGRVLDQMPADLTVEQQALAEEKLLERARNHTPEKLAKAAAGVLEEVRPSADPVEARLQRLEAQKRRAVHRRALTFHSDGDGSVQFSGSLPTVDAQALMALIDAYSQADQRRDREQRDRGRGTRSPAQRRADALVTLVAEHAGGGTAGAVAGDRPRVVVIMNESSLRERVEQAGHLPTGEEIAAGDLRRLVCDAVLAPVVLGTNSELLDVGREHRLVTRAIRKALSLRDGGCQFPACDAPNHRCEAHHVVPWWAGGVTSLGNLVLLCPYHHAQVEPQRFWSEDTLDGWRVRMHPDGYPEFIPPVGHDPAQTPIPGNNHHRHGASRGRGPEQKQLAPALAPEWEDPARLGGSGRPRAP